jgi:hypothetical protein
MNPQYAAEHLLCKIMGGVIPEPAKQQGMPMEAGQKVALGSPYAVHNGPHLISFNKLSRQGYAFLASCLLRISLQLLIVLGSLLALYRSPAWHLGIDIAGIRVASPEPRRPLARH